MIGTALNAFVIGAIVGNVTQTLPPEHGKPVSSVPLRILIAEDSPTQAARLRHTLQQSGYEVEVAANGALALAGAHERRPALIISDVVMPEMDGYELCRSIKANPGLRDIPIILVTTMSDPDDVIRGLESGADNFVLKPYHDEYLLGRVEYALSNLGIRRGNTNPDSGVEVRFNSRRHFITADRLQILDLLLSTYDAAIEGKKELERSHEQLRLLNEKLNETNKDLESFSYSASHDLRAPLRHISGYGGLLLEEAGEQLSAKGRRYLDEILGASGRMGQLIADLLEFARMGRNTLHETRVDLDELVRSGISELEMQTQGRNIQWHIDPLPAALGDPGMLKQVYVNLLGNAVKYTRPRSVAQIDVGHAGEEDGRIALFVRDNGVGFDMKHASKVFGAFERLHSADEFEGTGIGLATVRRIVERHGGRVWAEAAPDQGATFYFTLRRADVHEQ